MLYDLVAALAQDAADIGERVLAQGAQILRAKQGQAIFHAGDPSDAVYLLVEGEVRVFVSPPARTESRTTQLLRAPAILGDRDVLAERVAGESAVLLTAGKLVSIEAEVFRAAVDSDVRLKSLVLRDLAERYACAVTLFSLGLSSTSDLLEAVLADLSRGGSTARISAQDLAAITGAASKTIFRALATLRAREAKEPDEASDSTPRVFHSLRLSPLFG